LKYVIIGNSAAGVGAVEGIRRVDPHGKITVLTSEPYHTYSRPLISYWLLGKTDEEKMKYRDDDFYTRHRVTLLSGTRAVRVNAEQRCVVTADGGTLSYDRLLLAAGSSALVPPFEGLDTVPEKFTFMSLDDARALGNAVGTGARVLIVGAGLIGLKCAEGLSGKASVVCVDLAPRVLSSILDDESAGMVQRHLEAQGISFELSQKVRSFSGRTALLESGKVIEFDLLVLAVGVRPNTELLQGIADIRRGIVIDSKCRTSHPDIYAAGDCTQSFDVSAGQSKVMALLPNAYMQGETAGIHMAGGDTEGIPALPMNAIGFFGLHILTAGSYIGETYTETDKKNYKKLFYSDNCLNGYILVGNVEKAGIYTALVRERTPLDTLDFALICQKPGLMAFTGEDRRKKLGGNLGEA